MTLRLNCDLGEGFGSWKMGMDAAAMPHIDQANIACGFHAGDPLIMRKTLLLAKEHGVTPGAHPAYPDLVGFGRRSMNCSHDEIVAFVQYQVAAIDGIAKSLGMELEYVKPHGALYNDMMAKPDVRRAVMTAVGAYHRPLDLMLLATQQADEHLAEAAEFNLGLQFEAFADRCYMDDGKLTPRSMDIAVHTREKMLAQVEQLNTKGTVTTNTGKEIPVRADTLCVHGDNDEGVAAIAEIRALIHA